MQPNAQPKILKIVFLSIFDASPPKISFFIKIIYAIRWIVQYISYEFFINFLTYTSLSAHKLISAAHSMGGNAMPDTFEERACQLAVYMVENGATVRAAASHFGISKSTVHKDLQQRLPKCNPGLYEAVTQVLAVNKSERHIRGGMATRRKYKGE
jgi:putative DeoR family transcriptional regulator (stage III sporulation protein D)